MNSRQRYRVAFWIGLLSWFPVASLALNDSYPSQKWHHFEAASAPRRGMSESDAIRKFIDDKMPESAIGRWKEISRIQDSTHAHRLLQLEYQGLPVENHFLKIHYSRRGFVQYATSTWEIPWEQSELPARFQGAREPVLDWVRRELEAQLGDFDGQLKAEPVWWAGEDSSELISAYKVNIHWWRRGIFQDWIVGVDPLKLLEERQLMRKASATNRSVYKVSPLTRTSGTADTADIDDLDATSALSNSFLHVYFEKIVSGTPTVVDVDATGNYFLPGGAGDFSEDPAAYNMSSVATTCTNCENQKFEAVNVYYHLNLFRRYLASTYSTLGIAGTVNSLLDDPLNVVVNLLSIDFDNDGSTTNETNNAAYIPSPCRTGFSPIFDRCLIFLRPASETTTSCGGGLSSKQLYHLAREGNVIVHEYQHYITDRVTNMIAGSSRVPNVGDYLHEGYSDYLGASETTRNAGASANVIGAYAFQDCSPIIRNLGTLRPLQNNSSETDAHLGGQTWASGLWYLHDTLGATYTDKLALKSEFFLSPRPSYLEAVEALVQADDALGGGNAKTIRTLFYVTLKFLGGKTDIFRDPATGLVEVGFHSCLGTSPGRRAAGGLTALLFFVWLGGTVWFARRFVRR